MIATATTMTGAEFDALSYDEGKQCELIEGELVEMPTANAEHQEIVLHLGSTLFQYLRNERTGGVYPDVEFALGANLRLCPDLAILLGDKWRTLDRRTNPLPLAPDIAIEVISPFERTLESTRKVWAYLANGVTEVWQIFPEPAALLIHRTGRSIAVLQGTDIVETPLLPSWRISLMELFAGDQMVR